jgi:hypothetical protein
MFGHLALDGTIGFVREQVGAEGLLGDLTLETHVLLGHRLVTQSFGSLTLSSARSKTAMLLLCRNVPLSRGKGTASFLCYTIFFIDVHLQLSR